ncbi:MAG: hypothetical protein L3J50_13765, partial [Emcibacter sp.]|nr:hypothetical protein [Emcibacter sp.]
PVTVDYLSEIWYGSVQNDFASKMVIGTAAQALYLTGHATTVEQAERLVEDYWLIHLSHAM